MVRKIAQQAVTRATDRTTGRSRYYGEGRGLPEGSIPNRNKIVPKLVHFTMQS